MSKLTSFSENKTVELTKQAYELGLNRRSDLERILKFLRVNPKDETLHEILSEKIEDRLFQDSVDPNPFRSTQPIYPLPGLILLGKTPESNIPWLIEPSQLKTHMLICGRSGGGKTNIILLILAQILEGRKND